VFDKYAKKYTKYLNDNKESIAKKVFSACPKNTFWTQESILKDLENVLNRYNEEDRTVLYWKTNDEEKIFKIAITIAMDKEGIKAAELIEK
jgi:hypothetical protein